MSVRHPFVSFRSRLVLAVPAAAGYLISKRLKPRVFVLHVGHIDPLSRLLQVFHQFIDKIYKRSK